MRRLYENSESFFLYTGITCSNVPNNISHTSCSLNSNRNLSASLNDELNVFSSHFFVQLLFTQSNISPKKPCSFENIVWTLHISVNFSSVSSFVIFFCTLNVCFRFYCLNFNKIVKKKYTSYGLENLSNILFFPRERTLYSE